jgi:hypothetical protein
MDPDQTAGICRLVLIHAPARKPIKLVLSWRGSFIIEFITVSSELIRQMDVENVVFGNKLVQKYVHNVTD